MTDSPPDCPASPPLRAVLLGFGGRANVAEEAERLRPLIEKHATIVAADLTGSVDVSEIEADVAIVLGGDGSILRAAHQMGRRQLPVIAVNLGRLGFLADNSPAEVPGVLRDYRAGKLSVVEHLMLECTVLRGGEVVHRRLGLNEVAVQTGSPFAIIDVDLYIDSQWVTTYSCDGLIVGTPVGSTAHCLSAGGPILRKDLLALVIVPISPHALTNRPVVDSAARVYELAVTKPGSRASVVVDGRVLGLLEPEDRVRIVEAEPRFKLVAAKGHSYYQTLREKLGWSGRLRLNDRS